MTKEIIKILLVLFSVPVVAIIATLALCVSPFVFIYYMYDTTLNHFVGLPTAKQKKGLKKETNMYQDFIINNAKKN